MNDPARRLLKKLFDVAKLISEYPLSRYRCPECWGTGEKPSATITGCHEYCRMCGGNGYFLWRKS